MIWNSITKGITWKLQSGEKNTKVANNSTKQNFDPLPLKWCLWGNNVASYPLRFKLVKLLLPLLVDFLLEANTYEYEFSIGFDLPATSNDFFGIELSCSISPLKPYDVWPTGILNVAEFFFASRRLIDS